MGIWPHASCGCVCVRSPYRCPSLFKSDRGGGGLSGLWASACLCEKRLRTGAAEHPFANREQQLAAPVHTSAAQARSRTFSGFDTSWELSDVASSYDRCPSLWAKRPEPLFDLDCKWMPTCGRAKSRVGDTFCTDKLFRMLASVGLRSR